MATPLRLSDSRIGAALLLLLLVGAHRVGATDFKAARAQVEALARLTEPPAVHLVAGLVPSPPASAPEALFFEGLPWRGKPTRVFARVGVPAGSGPRRPAIVLVHGGGGTAFQEWVERWNAHGFVALAIAVEGQTDERNPAAPRGAQWQRHAWAGPARTGIYGDYQEPIADQWMFHAVGATVLAHSLLRARPDVDPARIGVMGISWGGVIVSTVIGLDPRFAFAISAYGCGGLAAAENQYGRALGGQALYREIWDPLRRMGQARLPVLWLSWPGDQHFPLDAQAATYRAAPGPRAVALLPDMKHSHPAAWSPPESYAFAESVVRTGRSWLRQTSLSEQAGRVTVEFSSSRPLEGARLVWTADRGFTGGRTWHEAPAALARTDGDYSASATLPRGATAWFINVSSGTLSGSSDYIEELPGQALRLQ